MATKREMRETRHEAHVILSTTGGGFVSAPSSVDGLERLPTAEYNYFAAVGSEMVKAVAAVDGDRWVSQPGADLYPHSGGLVDYCYEAGISSFTFEGRGSSFIVPDSAILPAGQEQLAAVVTMAQQVRV